MVRAGDLLRQHEEFSCVLVAVSACFDNTRSSPPSKLSSMAEEPSGAMAPEAEEEEGRDEGDVPGSSSREWLQLGLGTPPPPPPHVRRQQVPTELELFRDRPSSSSSPVATTQPTTTTTAMPEAGSGIRVVVPARQAGVWLALEAAADQGGGGEALLPQIPRNYLRIKDGRLTIRLLMKYLMNKLGLEEDESEVEITCRDQVLLPLWTLEYVRDNIWFSSDVAPMILPEASSVNHLMTLHYRRRKKDGPVHEPPRR
ncbi:unnamed protein product [Musa textilis]